MTYATIILIAIALSIDACLVSFSYGINYNNKQKLKNLLLLASFTGTFQSIMPILGYIFVTPVKTYIQPYTNLIVFLIFVYLGIQFIIESFTEKEADKLCIDIRCLILIGIATSIDAFSAGITLALYGNRILKPALLIGIITFINSSAGFWAGGNLKHIPKKALQIFAGLLLIILGVKALI